MEQPGVLDLVGRVWEGAAGLAAVDLGDGAGVRGPLGGEGALHLAEQRQQQERDPAHTCATSGRGLEASLTAFATMFDRLGSEFRAATAESGAGEPGPWGQLLARDGSTASGCGRSGTRPLPSCSPRKRRGGAILERLALALEAARTVYPAAVADLAGRVEQAAHQLAFPEGKEKAPGASSPGKLYAGPRGPSSSTRPAA